MILNHRELNRALKKADVGDKFHYVHESGEIVEKEVLSSEVQNGHLVIVSVDRNIPLVELPKEEKEEMVEIEKEVNVPWYKRMFGKSY